MPHSFNVGIKFRRPLSCTVVLIFFYWVLNFWHKVAYSSCFFTPYIPTLKFETYKVLIQIYKCESKFTNFAEHLLDVCKILSIYKYAITYMAKWWHSFRLHYWKLCFTITVISSIGLWRFFLCFSEFYIFRFVLFHTFFYYPLKWFH